MRESNEKYEIIETIATGGMAVLYKAIQVSLNRTVVIKKLHPHLAADKNFVERFEREAAILGQMSHPNIVNIIDYFIKDEDYYIVLEYIEGFSLSDLIAKQGALPLSVAVYILQEMLRGLSYAHSNKVLHRDIKPDNIMVEKKSAMIKLTDFGLATGESFKDLTRPGGYIGTVAYLAPEIIKGEKPSIQSDIYSVGLTFCEMLTGINPMKGDSEYDVINKILYHKKIDLDLPPTMPETVKDIFNKMIEFDKNKRYDNCKEILDDIEDLPFATRDQFKAYIESPVVKSGSLPMAKVTIEKRRKWERTPVIVMLISLSVFIGGFIGWLWNNYTYKVKPEQNKIMISDTLEHKNIIQEEDTIIDTVDIGIENKIIQKDSVIKKKTVTSLPDTGYLYIRVKPWAEVYIDNKYIDKTPMKGILHLAEGKHIVSFKHPHRKPYMDTIFIKKQDTFKLYKELQIAYGFVKILIKPWAEVFIDGTSVGITPIGKPVKLSIGKHEILLKNPRYGIWKDEIEIKENDTLSLSVLLQE